MSYGWMVLWFISGICGVSLLVATQEEGLRRKDAGTVFFALAGSLFLAIVILDMIFPEDRADAER